MTAIEQIQQAVESKDQARVQEIVGNISTFCFKSTDDAVDCFPEPLFNDLIKVIKSGAFLVMPGSGALLVIFEYDWARLNTSQKKRLLSVLEWLYPKAHDSSARFVAAELLGGFFANREAFEAVSRLNKHCANEIRVLLPLALENFAAETPDIYIKRDALEMLKRMQLDESESVREESAQSFSRLRSRGLVPGPAL